MASPGPRGTWVVEPTQWTSRFWAGVVDVVLWDIGLIIPTFILFIIEDRVAHPSFGQTWWISAAYAVLIAYGVHAAMRTADTGQSLGKRLFNVRLENQRTEVIDGVHQQKELSMRLVVLHATLHHLLIWYVGAIALIGGARSGLVHDRLTKLHVVPTNEGK